MEEAKKRKERLQALRMEADKAEVSDPSLKTSAASGHLTSPLMDSFANVMTEGPTDIAPRFDFYTDPMSAFSANRKKNQEDSQISQSFFPTPRPRNPEIVHSPRGWQSNCSSGQRIQQNQGPYYHPDLHTNAVGMVSHSPEMWKRSVAEYGYSSPSNFARGSGSPGPGFQPHFGPSTNYWQGQGQYLGSPSAYGLGSSGRGGDCWNGNSMRPSPQSAAGISYGSSNFPRASGTLGPRFQPPFSQSTNNRQSKGQYIGKSSAYGSGHGGNPSPSSERGGHHWNRNSTSASPGCGRGEGKGPDLYFLKSMLEDPWKNMDPVIRKVDVSSDNMIAGSSKSWGNKSFGIKKARVSESSDKSSSKQRLAEIIAAASNEVFNDN